MVEFLMNIFPFAVIKWHSNNRFKHAIVCCCHKMILIILLIPVDCDFTI